MRRTYMRYGTVVRTARGRKFQPAKEPDRPRMKKVQFEGITYWVSDRTPSDPVSPSDSKED